MRRVLAKTRPISSKNSPEYLFLDKTRFSKDELTREKLRINDLLVLFKTRTDRTHALVFGGKIFACPAADWQRKKCL